MKSAAATAASAFAAFAFLVSLASSGSVPNGHAWGCLPGNVSAHLPFCDHEKTVSERLDDLIGRLSLEEKIGLLSADSRTHVSSCNMMSSGVERLGIPTYMHLVETNTAVASTCLGPDKCSQNYPGPTGLGASFNRSLWKAKGALMGDEIRAFNNLNWYRATGDAPNSLIGLNGYGPNMNIMRDPRYGRGSEVPGEDPYLTGQYAVQMVRGAQGLDEYEQGKSPYLKATFGLKHYDLYSVEANRGAFIPNVTAHDLWETYLAQYAWGFSNVGPDGKSQGGGAMGTMCSYAGLNGVPSCANDYLLNKVIRGHFSRPDVVVGTDCGAVNNMVSQNHYASSKIDAAAKTINGGTDLELGDQFWSSKAAGGDDLLNQAVQSKMVDVARIDESVRRVLNLRFITGQFDPLELQPYASIGAEAVNSTASQILNLEAALQSFVLLKNDGGVLPMKRGIKTAVLGPHAFSTRDLMSDYKGDEQCVGGGSDFSCFPTIGQAFVRANGAENTLVEQGVEMDSADASGIPAALSAASKADQVLLFVGIGNSQEHEGIDRMNTTLPGLQEPFVLQVLAQCKKLGKPAAVVFINGGAVAFDPIKDAAPAIVEAFYPSVRGAEALALALFGDENRFGKLPITIYPKDFMKVDFLDFSMSNAPGRTYKYYSGEPLFPFGYGLSYATFSHECAATSPNATSIDCTVSLQSGPAGDEVLMAFHSVDASLASALKHPVPKRELVGFERLSVTSSETATFTVSDHDLGLVDQNGDRQLYAGKHYITITDGVAFEKAFAIHVEKTVPIDVVPKFA